MNDKCSKYQELFLSDNEQALNEHIAHCEFCREEYKKFKKVSNLINEVKPYYLKKRKRLRRLRAVAAILFIVFFSSTFGFIYSNDDLSDALMYGDTLTAEDLGFPVDSYGLLMVD